MAQLEVETRRQILDVTVALLDAARGSRVRLRDIADAANVAIPTIYYHYADRQSLLAEAQAVRLLGIFDEITDATSPTVNAITAADQDGYVEAVAETREPYWKPDNREAVWRSVEAMVEIRHDPEVFSRVSSVIEDRIRQRVDAVEQLQRMGWVTDQVNAGQWVLFYFGAAFGQVFWDLCPGINTMSEANTAVDWIHSAISPAGVDATHRKERSADL